RLGHRVGGEVGWDEGELAGRQAQPGDACALVLLGGRVVDLEPADAGPRVTEGTAVVADAADHDLRDPAVERGHHDAVEEGGPTPDVLVHAAGLGREAVRDVPGKGLVRLRVPVRRGGTLVLQAAGRDALRGARGGSFYHCGCLLVCAVTHPCRRLPRGADNPL